MTGMFFALAFLSAVNPKLLGVDLLLIDNERPPRMFACFLLSGKPGPGSAFVLCTGDHRPYSFAGTSVHGRTGAAVVAAATG